MLGAGETYEVGTFHWAESIGLKLDYFVNRPERYMSDLVPFVRQLVATSPPPWDVFPEPPCKSIDAYFELCTGRTYAQVVAMVDACGHHDLPRLLDVRRAENQQRETKIGRPRKGTLESRAIGTSLPRGSNNASHLLRRIARERPDVLAAYERGEFPSVRAAAREAGIVRKQTPVDRVVAAWTRLTEAERAEFSERIHSTDRPV